MIPQKNYRPLGCSECLNGAGLGFDISMAFQPIVNIVRREVYAYEALVRGINNESAGWVFQHVNDDNRYRFDQACRVKAIEMAAKVGVDTLLSINFMPNAVYRPELGIRPTLEAAHTLGFPVERIIFEITEGEQVADFGHLREIVSHYRERGFLTAIDDFGAGYSGLNMLAELLTDVVKLDMALIRDIDKNRERRIIVKGITQVCTELGIRVVGEGVETAAELSFLRDLGIELFQGYYFARPGFESLPPVSFGDN